MKPSAIYERVTNQIITELEAGTVPWVKPWKTNEEHMLPHNAVSCRPYSGVNVLLLWCAAEERNYTRAGWLTFKQARALDACVRKGEKGTHIVFVKKREVSDDDADHDEDTKTISVIRSYVVFNLCQIEGLPEAYQTVEDDLPAHERIEAIEAFVSALGIDIAHGGARAAYNPRHDTIVMPTLSSFEAREHYYATLFHELGHATGHRKRLARDLCGRFGSEAYAAEELVAELTSAYLSATFGIEGQLRHASYIESWLTLFRQDSRAIFTAAGQAHRAMIYLLQAADVPLFEDHAQTR